MPFFRTRIYPSSHFSDIGYIRCLIDETMLQLIDFGAFFDRVIPPEKALRRHRRLSIFGKAGAVARISVDARNVYPGRWEPVQFHSSEPVQRHDKITTIMRAKGGEIRPNAQVLETAHLAVTRRTVSLCGDPL